MGILLKYPSAIRIALQIAINLTCFAAYLLIYNFLQTHLNIFGTLTSKACFTLNLINGIVVLNLDKVHIQSKSYYIKLSYQIPMLFSFGISYLLFLILLWRSLPNYWNDIGIFIWEWIIILPAVAFEFLNIISHLAVLYHTILGADSEKRCKTDFRKAMYYFTLSSTIFGFILFFPLNTLAVKFVCIPALCLFIMPEECYGSYRSFCVKTLFLLGMMILTIHKCLDVCNMDIDVLDSLYRGGEHDFITMFIYIFSALHLKYLCSVTRPGMDDNNLNGSKEQELTPEEDFMKYLESLTNTV